MPINPIDTAMLGKRLTPPAWVLAWVFCVVWGVLGADAASFDCGRATTQAEAIVCTDLTVGMLDEMLSRVYRTALRVSPKRERIRAQQRQWIRTRDTCSDVECVQGVYARRLTQLQAISAAPPVRVRPTLDVSVGGFVNKLRLSTSRSLLFAAVGLDGPYDPTEKYGLYVFSLADPTRPQQIGYVPIVNPTDVAVSPDGTLAFVLNTWSPSLPDHERYGVIVIDVSEPDAPQVVTIFERDAVTMHLSHDGQYVFVQEQRRADHRREDSEMFVLSGTRPNPGLPVCTITHRLYFGQKMFALGFATFPRNPFLAVRDASGPVVVLNIRDPCGARVYFEIRYESFGVTLLGSGSGMLYVAGNGLYAYELGRGFEAREHRWWPGLVRRVHLDGDEKALSTAFGDDALVFRVREDGGLDECERYRLRQRPTDVIILDTQTLYVVLPRSISVLKRDRRDRCG